MVSYFFNNLLNCLVVSRCSFSRFSKNNRGFIFVQKRPALAGTSTALKYLFFSQHFRASVSLDSVVEMLLGGDVCGGCVKLDRLLAELRWSQNPLDCHHLSKWRTCQPQNVVSVFQYKVSGALIRSHCRRTRFRPNWFCWRYKSACQSMSAFWMSLRRSPRNFPSTTWLAVLYHTVHCCIVICDMSN